MKRVFKYFKVWKRNSINTFSSMAATRINAFAFLLGKIVRFGIFISFFNLLFNKTESLAGFSNQEVVLFFLTMYIVDLLAQILFRGVYEFPPKVNRGTFDYFLVQPISPLFRSLTTVTDFLDVIMSIPVLIMVVWSIFSLGFKVSAIQVLFYGILIFNSFLIATAIHIFVVSLTVIAIKADFSIWIYRDLMTLGRFPPDIYPQGVRLLLIFVVPIMVMVSFPAKFFLGILEWPFLIWAFLCSGIFLKLSLSFWQYALKRYQSASS